VDGLSAVVQKLTGPHLNLVLHGGGGDLGAAAEVVSLLRGRFEVIRALVPNCALSALALVACACDAVMMPETAVIGALDDDHHKPVSASVARDWLIRNCAHPDRPERAQAAGVAFAATDGPRAPLSASHAKEHGLPVNIVPEQSALGRDLEEIWQGLESAMREKPLVRLIDCQKGPMYAVEG
jgi:membrane-bound ClpP family serine protease